MTWTEYLPGVYIGIPPQTLRENAWRYFTPGTDETEARAVYALREGAQPDLVGVNQFGQVLAGPVPTADRSAGETHGKHTSPN